MAADTSWAAFFKAIVSGDTGIVREGLRTKDFRFAISYDTTSMGLAASYGHKDILREMMTTELWQKQHLLEKQRFVQEMLINAIRGATRTCGHLDLVEWLLAECHAFLPTDMTEIFSTAVSVNADFVLPFLPFVHKTVHCHSTVLRSALSTGNEVLRLVMREGEMTREDVVQCVSKSSLLIVGCSLNDATLVNEQLSLRSRWWHHIDSPPDDLSGWNAKICPLEICCTTGNVQCLKILVTEYITRSRTMDVKKKLSRYFRLIMPEIIRRNQLTIAQHLFKEDLLELDYPHKYFDSERCSGCVVRTETFDHIWQLVKHRPYVEANGKDIALLVSAQEYSVLEYFKTVLVHLTEFDWAPLLLFMDWFNNRPGVVQLSMLFHFLDLVPDLKKPKRGPKTQGCSARVLPSRAKSSRPDFVTISSKCRFYHQATGAFDCGNRKDVKCLHRLPNPVMVELILDLFPMARCPCGNTRPMIDFLIPIGFENSVETYYYQSRLRPTLREPLELEIKHAEVIFDLLAKKGIRPTVKQVQRMIRLNFSRRYPESLYLSRLLCLADTYDLSADVKFGGHTRFDMLLWFAAKYFDRDEFLTRLFISFSGSEQEYGPSVRLDAILPYLITADARKEHFLTLFEECQLNVWDDLYRTYILTRTVSDILGRKHRLAKKRISLQSRCRVKIREVLRSKCNKMNRTRDKAVTTVSGLVDRLCEEVGLPGLIRDYLHFQWFVNNVRTFEHLPADRLHERAMRLDAGFMQWYDDDEESDTAVSSDDESDPYFV